MGQRDVDEGLRRSDEPAAVRCFLDAADCSPEGYSPAVAQPEDAEPLPVAEHSGVVHSRVAEDYSPVAGHWLRGEERFLGEEPLLAGCSPAVAHSADAKVPAALLVAEHSQDAHFLAEGGYSLVAEHWLRDEERSPDAAPPDDCSPDVAGCSLDVAH